VTTTVVLTLAEQVIAVLASAATSPEVLAAVDAWIHGAGSEKLAIAAARKTAEAGLDVLEAAVDGATP
jgi:hypothetical protein